MKIIFTGGGTMGSVSPLIAVYEKIKALKPESDFLFIGTKNGPESKVIATYRIPFKAIAAGKFRRYLSWYNFFDLFLVVIGCWQSWRFIRKFKPDAIMAAGSFVGVPVVWAAWLARVPVLIHQQDIIAGLANKLMANFAKKITVSFEISLKDFSSSKTVLTGNPVREELWRDDSQSGKDFFKLKNDRPTVLVLGGGTGAQAINDLVEAALPEMLKFCQVIHLTGAGKGNNLKIDDYHQFEFLTNEMPEALAAADLVISRAGISTLSELAILAKPAILIPIPDSHQEFNAQYFQRNNAALVLFQKSLNEKLFVSIIKEIIFNKDKLNNLSSQMKKIMNRGAAERIAKLIFSFAR